ncbi:hypothetical protein ElyMa_003634800 [Elysia marginata]|uniref:Uncharacterized protein n=1 Tax=Elysia marginata TaxID=1093978 RepID=A0AAV4EUY7_9GAST|nr:hypothetical protein ElyMa_003634800 [Elysia marginata]
MCLSNSSSPPAKPSHKTLSGDCELQYFQGPNLLIADTLSRAVGTDSSHRIADLQINSIFTIPDMMLTTIRNAVNDDQTLQTLQRYIIDGWPPNKLSIPALLECTE